MNVVTALIISTVALAVCAVLIVLLTVMWLKAEYKVFLLGGETKWFRKPKNKGGNR